MNLQQLWTFNWQSLHYEETNGNTVHLGEDHSVIRAFSEEDVQLFLQLTGFETLEVIKRDSYAFDTLVFVAAKK
jgi:hypothetical protein